MKHATGSMAVALACCLAGPFLWTASPVEAQYTRLDQVNRQVSQMRGELQYLAGELNRLKSGSGGTTPDASQLEVKFSRLERQFQQLTGTLEELGFQVRNSENENRKFRTQIADRMAAIEAVGRANTTALANMPVATGNWSADDWNTGDWQSENSIAADKIPSLYSGSSPGSGSTKGAVGVELSSFPSVGDQGDQGSGAGTATGTNTAFDPYRVAVPADVSLPDSGTTNPGVDADPDPVVSGPARDRGRDSDAAYQRALASFQEGKLEEAQAAFLAFLRDHETAVLAGNASYWLGETHYSLGNFTRAAHQFSTGFAKYRDSAKAPDHLYKLALSLERLGRFEEACASLGLLDRKFADERPALMEKAAVRAINLSCAPD